MNRITFLGVWMTPDVGETVSFVIDLDSGARVLVDCGTNLVRSLVDNNIDPTTITHILITHSHGDHISGLPTYLFYRLMISPGIFGKNINNLKVLGTQNTIESVKNYVRIPYGNLADNTSIQYVPIKPVETYRIDDAYFHFFNTKHLPETIGFFTEINNKKIAYSADTSLSEKIISIVQNADILIHDIVGTSKFEMLSGGHTLCNQIGGLLNKYNIKSLYPVHRLSIYKNDINAYLEELKRDYLGEVYIPNDGDVFVIN